MSKKVVIISSTPRKNGNSLHDVGDATNSKSYNEAYELGKKCVI